MLGSWDAFLVRQLCECMRVQYFLKWDDNDTLSYRKICAIRLFCQELVALAKHRGVKANGKKASTDLALGDSVLVGPGEEILYIYGHRQNYGTKRKDYIPQLLCCRWIFHNCCFHERLSNHKNEFTILFQDRFPISSVSFHNCILPTHSVVFFKSGWFCPDGNFP